MTHEEPDKAGAADIAVSHANHVYAVAEGQESAPGLEPISTSWQRCVTEYGVDPGARAAPRILTVAEVKDVRDPIEALIESAGDELDRLHALVSPAGYIVLLTDKTGVAVEHRADEAQESDCRHWGIWLGGVWTESVEGTNGIGTCITEARPVTVHRGQHFRSRHIDLSCSGAPILEDDGTLLAVVDVSAYDPELSEGAHALTGALVLMSARAIEERYFRQRYRRHWIGALALPQESGPGALLALDGARRIVGANWVARKVLGIDEAGIRDGVGLSSLFHHDSGLFRRRDGADIPTRMICVNTHEEVPALVTPPERVLSASGLSFHTRPRSDLLATVQQFVRTPQSRGGLPPTTMRRVRDYVEVHIGEPIELTALATVAGVSVFHFAREFKRSAGVTPHYYLVQKRIERAQSLLNSSDLTPSQIAQACGFTDQSHLARRFRQVLGVTPGQYRRTLQ
jgi:AraC-like DNA-binding protein/PAS domain-containing protein